jgi:hypothetical protein
VPDDVKCLCGFTELEDESLTDHLLAAFIADDATGSDGVTHEETSALRCSCGFAASAPGDLDEHFLTAFTPEGAIGRDGKKHLITLAFTASSGVTRERASPMRHDCLFEFRRANLDRLNLAAGVILSEPLAIPPELAAELMTGSS